MKEEINLLPPGQLRARVHRLYGQRLRRLYWSFMVGLSMVAATYGSLYGIENALYQDIQRQVKESNGNDTSLQSQVQQANSLLAAFSSAVASQVLWTEMVDEVLAAVPADTVITNVSVKESAASSGAAEGTKPQVVPSSALIITGRSSSRTSIVEYERRLQQLSLVKRVEAPLQNLAGGAANTFSFTLYQ